jgi:hypothetical protein
MFLYFSFSRQVAKAQIEKAEVKADLTKERLEIYQVKRHLYIKKEADLELTCTKANFRKCIRGELTFRRYCCRSQAFM